MSSNDGETRRLSETRRPSETQLQGRVVSVHRSEGHAFSKEPCDQVELLAGLGVAGDTHLGAQVQHRSRVKADPTQPNLRQVHLMHSELFTNVKAAGFEVAPGDLGENITTSGIDLLSLPVGTVLRIGEQSLLACTGLRNPCGQIESFQAGLLKQLVFRDSDGVTQRLGGIMAVVVLGGVVRPGDEIIASLPPLPHRPMERV